MASISCSKDYQIVVTGCPIPVPLVYACPGATGKTISWSDGLGPVFADSVNRVAAESDNGSDQIAMIDFTIPVPAVAYYLAGPSVGSKSRGMFYDHESHKILTLTRVGGFGFFSFSLSIFDPVTGLQTDTALPELTGGTHGWNAVFTKVSSDNNRIAMLAVSSTNGDSDTLYLINPATNSIVTKVANWLVPTFSGGSICYSCSTKQIALYFNSTPPQIVMVNKSTLATENTFNHTGSLNGVGLAYADSVGKMLLLWVGGQNKIAVIDPTTGNIDSTVTTPGTIQNGSIFYNFPTDAILLSAQSGDRVWFYDGKTQTLKCTTIRADFQFPFWFFSKFSTGLPYCLDAAGFTKIHELL